MAHISSLAEAIKAAVRDGDTVALEGFTHLIPHAAGHEIIRQGRKDLTLIRMTPDLIYDQLIGMGCVKKLVFSWGGNPGVGSLHRFRDAVENGWPHKLEIEEHSHAAMANAYEAGAAGLPCAIFRGYIGGDLPKVNPKIKRIDLPVHRRGARGHSGAPAGRRGDPCAARRQGRQCHDRGRARRAEGSGARLEALGRDGRGDRRRAPPERSLNAVVLPHWTVGHVVEVPGGAFPSYAQGYYPRNNSFYKQWDEIVARARHVPRLDEGKRARQRAPRLLPSTRASSRGGGVRSMADYKPNEMMTIAAARALKNDDVCFVGIGQPSAACNLARLTHAPDITLIYESGTLATKPNMLPLSIGDGELCETALTTVSVPEMFRYWLQGGRIKVGFLGGAQIDKYANLNTTVVGPYDKPKVRLPGGGGAPEIATSCGEIFIIMAQGKRSFVDKLDFVTSIGHVTGGDSRAKLGVKTKGPTKLITDLACSSPIRRPRK